jgi:transcriptional regulator with XRE-family HTH domain
LLTIRQGLGLSQPRIAKHLGIREYTNVSKWERDINEPPLMIVLAYARLAEIPAEYLIDDALDLPL